MSTLADLHGVGVDIVTIGQYLRPTSNHLPVARWWDPDEFARSCASRGGHGNPPRGGVAADPVELPRPPGGRRGGRRGREPAAGRPGGSLTERRDGARVARLERVRGRMAELGVDALLLSLGADLPWLTGYEAMPLERLTMLVLPVDAEATLVVPGSRRPGWRSMPERLRAAPWSENEDPVALVAGLVGARRQLAVSDRTWASFVLALQQRLARRGLAAVVVGHRSAAGGQGRRRDRGPGRGVRRRRPGRGPTARRGDPAGRPDRARGVRRTSAGGWSRRAIRRSTSPSSAAAPMRPARTTTPAAG